MKKTKKAPEIEAPREMPRLNQVLALLVRSKGTQISVANALGISSQSLGYYIKGRRIPAEVIERWERVYNQNLIAISKVDFVADMETIISNGTAIHHDGSYLRKLHGNGHSAADDSRIEIEKIAKQAARDREFDKAVENEAITAELWKQLVKDHAQFKIELDRCWSIIDRLVPQAKQAVKGVDTDKGQ
jgi:hypothetical protein